MIPPTPQEICDDLLELVQRDVDDSWRHGNYVTEIYHRLSDDTYWDVSYRKSGDGEYNELREQGGSAAFIKQVTPVSKVITIVEYHDVVN